MSRNLVAAAVLSLATPALAEVPISIAPSGHATVPVDMADGATHAFVFDTGAEGAAVYQDFSSAAKLPPAATRETLIGQTGAGEVDLVRLPPLSVDGVRAEGLDAVVLPRRADGVRLAGIVGLDLFGSRLVDFDLPRRRVALHASGTALAGLHPADAVRATPVAGGLLTVPVRIDGVEATAVIDTGARRTRINWMLGRLLGLTPETIARGADIQGATNAATATGDARVGTVRLGGRSLDRPRVLVADLPVFRVFGVADRPAVILGLDWLERTRMVVDFPLRRAWFVAA